MKMIEMSASTMTCPAVMFANRRIVSANGFVNFPRISTGVMIDVISDLAAHRHVVRPVDDRADVVLAQRAHARDLDDDERDDRQRRRHRDVAGRRRAVGNEPEQVREQDEEEDREEVRHEPFAVRSDVRQDDFVPDVEHHRLDGARTVPGRFVLRAVCRA